MPVERRTRRRFPLNLELRFSSRQRRNLVEGTGTVVDISSKGVAFRTDVPLAPGMAMAASLSWPAALNGECALQLKVDGHILRTQGALTVMTVDKYEFRTSGRIGAPGRANIVAMTEQFGKLLSPAQPM